MFTPKYFIYLVAILSSIFKNSISISLFLVYRNAVIFDLVSCDLNKLTISSRFVADSTGFSTQTIMLLDYSSRLKKLIQF